MDELSVFHFVMWVGGDININSYTFVFIYTVYMLSSVIKNCIHLSYLEDQSNLKIYNKKEIKRNQRIKYPGRVFWW